MAAAAGNWRNVVLAVSNVACVVPVGAALAAGDGVGATLALAAGAASALYHTCESHKHGMPGFGTAPATSRRLLQVDRLGVAALALYVAWTYVGRYGLAWTPAAASPAALFLGAAALAAWSEWDHSPRTRTVYLWAHTAWHVLVFLALGRAMRVALYV